MWIGIKVVPPKRFAEHGDQGAAGFIFGVNKRAAQYERQIRNLEEAGRRINCGQALRELASA